MWQWKCYLNHSSSVNIEMFVLIMLGLAYIDEEARTVNFIKLIWVLLPFIRFKSWKQILVTWILLCIQFSNMFSLHVKTSYLEVFVGDSNTFVFTNTVCSTVWKCQISSFVSGVSHARNVLGRLLLRITVSLV